MVILKNGDFLRTMKSGFRPFWNETLQILGICYFTDFFYSVMVCQNKSGNVCVCANKRVRKFEESAE